MVDGLSTSTISEQTREQKMEAMKAREVDWHSRITDWMRDGGQTVADEATLPRRADRKLRARLILEEALETCRDLGFDVVQQGETGHASLVSINSLHLLDEPNYIDPVGIIDGCCDLMVVTLGTLTTLGIESEPHMEEVLRANEEKFAGGVIRDSGGKILKPDGWQPPNHQQFLPEEFVSPEKGYWHLDEERDRTDPCSCCDCKGLKKFLCKIKGWMFYGER